jgi:hypothetical protein
VQRLRSAGSAVVGFVDRRYFLVGVVAAVALAALFPTVGMAGGPLRPELTVAWGATCGIFLLAGLNLPTSELARAAVAVRLHALIQGFNLLLIPLCTLVMCNVLTSAALLPPALRDGMLVRRPLGPHPRPSSGAHTTAARSTQPRAQHTQRTSRPHAARYAQRVASAALLRGTGHVRAAHHHQHVRRALPIVGRR